MTLPSKISFVIFFNSVHEIYFTFLMFSSNFFKESYPPDGKWI